MKYDKLFEVMIDMRENPEGDYKGFAKPLNQKQKGKFVKKAIQAFMHNIANGTEKRSIQAFSGSTDLPKLTKDVFNVTIQTQNFDLSWQKAFRGVPLMKGQLEWEIATVSDATQFKLTPEGAKCFIGSVSGEKLIADVQKYSKGLGFTWEMMEGRKLWKFVETLESARDKLYGLWALIHYGLLATAAATNPVAWVAGTNDLDRDIKTINAGAALITTATKDSGYGDTAQAQLIMYVSPLLRDRMDAALKATRTELIVGGVKQAAPVSWPVEVLYTYNSQIPANKAVMVLPGHKIQNAVYMQEMSLEEKDIETLSKIRTYWTAFGAVVADNDQTAELAFS